jgi:hypothetical protein
VQPKTTIRPMISHYDDLYLEEDIRNMSLMRSLADEGSYYSLMTSYNEEPVLMKKKSL